MPLCYTPHQSRPVTVQAKMRTRMMISALIMNASYLKWWLPDRSQETNEDNRN